MCFSNNNLYGWKRKDKPVEKWPEYSVVVEFDGRPGVQSPQKGGGSSLLALAE